MNDMYSIALFIYIAIIMIISVSFGILIGIILSKKNVLSKKPKAQLITVNEQEQEISAPNNLPLGETIRKIMEELKSSAETDFIGLAIFDVMTDEIRWRLAVGESNDRYKRIVIRLGKGVSNYNDRTD